MNPWTRPTVALCLAAGVLAAEEPASKPAAAESRTEWATPDTPAPQAPAGSVSVRRRPGKPLAGTGANATLAGMKAVSTTAGEATLVVAGQRRVVKPGDRIGGDVIQSVDEGVLVLERPPAAGQAGGAATIVVRFDGAGSSRVRVFYEQDPTPVVAPKMNEGAPH